MPLPDANNYSMRIYELLKETDLENLSYAQFQAVAEKLFIEPENEDEMRRLVLVQLARMAVRGDWDGFLTGGGGSGAPTDAEYVVMQLNGTLTNERKLTAGTGISITDGGAGGNVTIASTVTSDVTSIVAGDAVVLPSGGTGDVTVSVPIAGDLILPSYVTLGTDTTLQNERVLTAGTGITLTDGGAGSTLTVSASGGGGGTGYQPELPQRFNTSRELFLVSCMPPWGNTQSSSTSSTTANNLTWFRPFISPVTGTVTEIQVNVNSAADTPDYILGIYSNTNGLPDTKIAEANVSIATTGTLAVSTFTGTPALVAGTQYHFAWVRKDTSGGGNFTAETASTCFKYGPVGQTFPSLASISTNGAVLGLSSSNVLPATITTSSLNTYSANPIRFGLRWD